MIDEQRKIRPPAAAGTFYPADAAKLRAALGEAFAQAREVTAGRPRVLIVPHAGYGYSGPIAATGYQTLAGCGVRRVALLGPSHRVLLDGCAASTAAAFATPLGEVPVDRSAVSSLIEAGTAHVDDAAHAWEHSLEVQLPFLQVTLTQFTIVPVTVGRGPVAAVAEVVRTFIDEPDTAVVVSTDLSHYHDYRTATARDSATAEAITAGRWADIRDSDACGAHALRGALVVTTQCGLTVELLDLRNSADTAGDPDRVVGYGAFAAA